MSRTFLGQMTKMNPRTGSDFLLHIKRNFCKSLMMSGALYFYQSGRLPSAVCRLLTADCMLCCYNVVQFVVKVKDEVQCTAVEGKRGWTED